MVVHNREGGVSRKSGGGRGDTHRQEVFAFDLGFLALLASSELHVQLDRWTEELLFMEEKVYLT